MTGKLINECLQSFESAGLRCDRGLLARFVSSLLTKRFAILTGLAGSGKTKLAQGFARWLSPKSCEVSDPFSIGSVIPSGRISYLVKNADSLSIEFWNASEEDAAIKVTLPRALIQEWVDYISSNDIPETTSARPIREAVSATTKYSTQLNSFETHLKAAAFAALGTPPVFTECRRVQIVPVGADWTSSERVLGYPNGLDHESYVSTPSLDLIIRATENPNHPHFLVLDEMNLSHVERYFADILSAIESEEPIALHSGHERRANGRAIPTEISLPDNLFIIGTVNVDETTYMFSPKVLDRANVIEFRMEPAELDAFLKNPIKPNLHELGGAGEVFGQHFVSMARGSTELPVDWRNPFESEMSLFFKSLSLQGAEFGYRVAHEAARFASYFETVADFPKDADGFDAAFDCIVVQKFLPKLHGSRAKLGPLLKILWFLCTKKPVVRGSDALGAAQLASRSTEKAAEPGSDLPDDVPYPLSAVKIGRMWRLLNDNGFASFAEA
jgi:hypothetical protein